jgi:hypothetical protein
MGEMAASLPLPTPMHCAFRAAAYRLLLTEAMTDTEEEGSTDKNETEAK